MPVIPINGFIGPSYTNRSSMPDGERSVELFPENAESGHGKSGSVASLVGRPGTVNFGVAPLSDSPVRCLWAGDNRLFAVSGGTFFEVFQDGTFHNRGAVNVSASPAQILLNGTQAFITSGGQGYIDNGVAISAVIPASTGTFMDGYFIAAQPNSNKFNISALNDGSSWDPLDFGVKQGYPDAISAIYAAFEQLWIFGFDTTEVWYDSGAANFPFQRIPGGLINYGCYAPFSVAIMENAIMWLGGASFTGHGVVYLAQGLVPQRVSNHALEYKIQNEYGNIQDAVGYTYQDSGHHFYVLSFPSADATWVYDLTTGSWHERGFWNTATGQYNAALARTHAFVWDKHIVGDWRSGQLYTQSLNYYTDAGTTPTNGNPIRRLRASPHISENMLWTRYSQLLLDMAVGDAAVGLNPQMMMRWSDNGGRTWSNEKWASAGPAGQYNTRVIWRRLGRSRDRVFEISTTDATSQIWIGAYVQVDQGDGV